MMTACVAVPATWTSSGPKTENDRSFPLPVSASFVSKPRTQHSELSTSLLRCHHDWMIQITCRISDACADILPLQIREVGQNLLILRAPSEHIQTLLHSNSHSPHAWPSSTLRRIDSDPFHTDNLADPTKTCSIFRFPCLPSLPSLPSLKNGLSQIPFRINFGHAGKSARG